MLNKKYFILFCIFSISFLAITGVSAKEITTGNLQDNNEDVMIDNTFDDFDLIDSPSYHVDDSSVVISDDSGDTEDFNDSDDVEFDDEDYYISTATTFTELQAEIQLYHAIKLSNDIWLTQDELKRFLNGIPITSDIIINGNGHSINANLGSRIYNVAESGSLHLLNLNMKNGKADNGGAIYNSGQLTCENCCFENNQASKMGGAIYSKCYVKLFGCTFISNHADYGGAIYNSATMDCDNSMYEENYASHDGGAIYSTKNIELSGCTFNNNIADGDYGGAVFCSSNVICTDCVFRGNNAEEKGGAIYAGGKVKATNCQFISNSVSDNNIFYDNDGGAIYSKSTVEADNCLFDSNTAKVNGGAIYAVGKVTVRNCSFINNLAYGAKTANCHGGAIYSENEVFAYDCRFEGNGAEDYGGAIYANEKVYLENCILISNYATNDDGGAVYSDNTVEARYCTFISNHACDYGGAIYSENGITCFHCLFESNAAEKGGAIYMDNGATLTAEYCKFYYNTAENGGALYLDDLDSNLILLYNEFISNVATKGVGADVYTYGSYNVHDNYYGSDSPNFKNKRLYHDGYWWWSDSGYFKDSHPLTLEEYEEIINNTKFSSTQLVSELVKKANAYESKIIIAKPIRSIIDFIFKFFDGNNVVIVQIHFSDSIKKLNDHKTKFKIGISSFSNKSFGYFNNFNNFCALA